MLYSKKSITATVFSLLLKRVSATTPDVYTHDATRTKASTLFSNSSMSTIQKTILPSSQRNLSTALSDGTSQAPVASANGLEFASSQSSASSNTSGTSSKSGSVQEYSFTYPGYVAGSYLQVSYKDTISASWISVPPEHSPNILIQCWDRNTTTSSTYLLKKPITTITLATEVDTMSSNFQVPLAAYKDYSPCQLLLQDLNTTGLDGGAGTANSSAFVISDTNSSAGQTWSLNNIAPAAMEASGTGDATVGMKRTGILEYVTFLGLLVGTVLFA